MKKSSYSGDEYLQQMPLEADIRVKDGASDIPIAALQNALDFFHWETENFHWQMFKDGYANLCVAAALELVLNYEDDDGVKVRRSFVGACNFSLVSLAPIPHFLATAKSLCIKNAAADAGRKLGRGLNHDHLPKWEQGSPARDKVKIKPDNQIKKQYLQAIVDDDRDTIEKLTNIYDLKPHQDGDQTI